MRTQTHTYTPQTKHIGTHTHIHTDSRACLTFHRIAHTDTWVTQTVHRWQLIRDCPHTHFKHTHPDSPMTLSTFDLGWRGLLSDGVGSFSVREVISCHRDCERCRGLYWLTSNGGTVGGLMIWDKPQQGYTTLCRKYRMSAEFCNLFYSYSYNVNTEGQKIYRK